jgi:16S rRNA (guanine527-N7)-methyltransferase
MSEMISWQSISHYFPNLDAKQNEQFQMLYELYSDWNAKINVISRKDMAYFYVHHVLHSLSISKFVQFEKGAQILDVGTGGGFPGIPLAILFPDVEFLCVDSINKKITVVNEVAKSLGLNNCRGEWTRVEQVNQSFDFIVSRAVTAFPDFYKWVFNKVRSKNIHEINNGIIYLKGGDLTEELKDFHEKVRLIPISDYFNETFFETKKIVYLPFK